ncbi:MAG: hypothetical protein WAM30_09230 [Candidatus Dormiibacterota bacterium]
MSSKETNELLGIYLNDHLAGSVAGRDLTEKIRAHNEGSAVATFMDGLRTEIDEDQETLAGLLRQLGVEQSSVKQFAGSMLEKVSRTVFDTELDGSSALNLLLELEGLSIGIEGKLSLWRTLQTIGNDSAGLHLDVDRLIERAQRQLEGLEQHRLEAARAAFVAEAPSS